MPPRRISASGAVRRKATRVMVVQVLTNLKQSMLFDWNPKLEIDVRNAVAPWRAEVPKAVR
jgi:hypothetical protein